MPGHIFIRTGEHEKSLETNRAAAAVDEAYFARIKDPGMYSMYYMHNLHFIAVEAAYLGHSEEAMATAKKIYEHMAPRSADMPFADAFMAVQPFVAAWLHRWDDCLALEEPPPSAVLANYARHYARAMAFANQNKIDEALANPDKFKELKEIQQAGGIDDPVLARAIHVLHLIYLEKQVDKELLKKADVTVFSKDLMTVAPAEILKAETVLTVVDGKVVFEK